MTILCKLYKTTNYQKNKKLKTTRFRLMQWKSANNTQQKIV